MKLTEYQPRQFALGLHNRNGKRWTVMVNHRRCGKTVSCIADLTVGALECPLPNPQFAYFAPFRSQAKSVAWTYLKEMTRDHWAKPPNEAELTVFLKSKGGVAKIFCGGTDNMDSLRGNYFDGLVIDEVGQVAPQAWYSILRPALSDRKGWAIFAGTPAGYNLFWNLREEARLNPDTHLLIEVKASESGILDPDELRDAKAQMTEDAYMREFECSFDASVAGSIFGKDIGVAYSQGRIKETHQADMSMPVEIIGDLGYTDSCSWWVWQTTPDGYRIVDFYEASGAAISHYIDWIKDLPYKVEQVWLPHDARAKSLQTGRSMIEAFLEAGIRPQIVPNMAILDGIEAARQVLPLCYFDEKKTAEGIAHLRGYSREWDDKNQIFKMNPKHDQHSHASDSFRYFSLVAKKVGKSLKQTFHPEEKEIAVVKGSHQAYSLDDIWDLAPQENRRIG